MAISFCKRVLNTHASTVKLPVPGLRFGLSGTSTRPSMPSKLNACPTSPGANVAPPCSVPGLLSQISLALPSPGHQETMFEGGGTHDGVGVGVGVTSGEPVTMTPGPGLFGRALFHRFCPNPTSAREMPVKQIATPSKSRGLRNADWEEKIFRTRERFTSHARCKSRKILRKLGKKWSDCTRHGCHYSFFWGRLKRRVPL